MTDTVTPGVSRPEPPVRPEPTAHRAPQRADACWRQTTMWLQRPTRGTAIVHVIGELDTLNVARLEELLMPRLASTLRALVVDLSHVTFLGVDALRVLNTAHHRATARGKSLRLVTGPAAVDRALLAAGLADVVEIRHDQHSALRDEHDPTEPHTP